MTPTSVYSQSLSLMYQTSPRLVRIETQCPNL